MDSGDAWVMPAGSVAAGRWISAEAKVEKNGTLMHASLQERHAGRAGALGRGPYTDELLAAKKLGRLAAKLLSHPVDRIGE